MKKKIVMGSTACAWPECSNKGIFPAPCDSKDLRKRIYLCADHITQYNKSWNGLEGFSSDEIFSMQSDPSWDKPTWALGQKQKLQEGIFKFTHARDKETKGFEHLGDDFDLGEAFNDESGRPKRVTAAMTVLNLEEPLTLAKAKKAYKKEVKHNHPDRVKNKIEAEEVLKQINLAYQTLKKYLK
ncbi:MAG: J domain-containing protein [Proteobacteria bacterium]|nr:J domain-containing protein [Pseudomonadota bacterium]